MKNKKSIRQTIIVSMSNYLESGAIVAGASGLSLWINYLNLNDLYIGILGAISANGFSAAIGAILSGYLIDKYGRKFIYEYSLLVYIFGTTLIIFAFNFLMLALGYFIVGFAVGALIPAAWTYIAEEAPDNKRGSRIGWSQFAWSLGPAIIFTLSTVLMPLGLLGSRIIFIQLLIVAIITWILQKEVNESKIWEEENKKQSSTKILNNINKSDLYTIKPNIQAFAFLIGMYFFWNLVAGIMGYFMPYIYGRIGNLTNLKANSLQSILWITTAVSTYYIFIKFVDNKSRKLLFSCSAIIGIIAWIILVSKNITFLKIFAFVILWGVSAGFSAQAFYALFSSELFHTKYRAQAQGIMFCSVRVGVGIISLFVPVSISKFGFHSSAMVMIAFLFLSLIIGVLMMPNTQGKSLRHIEKERYNDYYKDIEVK
jgi:inositol transporter-like SP family MFS transporter